MNKTIEVIKSVYVVSGYGCSLDHPLLTSPKMGRLLSRWGLEVLSRDEFLERVKKEKK